MTYIVTLQLDAESQAHFERMRQAYFPPERNQIAAHLTLFHTLPEDPEITDALSWVAGERSSFTMHTTGLRSLGKGVAYTLRSAELLGLHQSLAEIFRDHLSAQDQQKFQPHVVIQNKATAEQARALLKKLESTFEPFPVQATGLELWHYLGGPWELAQRLPFAG